MKRMNSDKGLSHPDHWPASLSSLEARDVWQTRLLRSPRRGADRHNRGDQEAYRRLALQYHPDRNIGDREAETNSRKSPRPTKSSLHEDKRARYDRYGHAGVNGEAAEYGPAGYIFRYCQRFVRRLHGRRRPTSTRRRRQSAAATGDKIIDVQLQDLVAGSQNQRPAFAALRLYAIAAAREPKAASERRASNVPGAASSSSGRDSLNCAKPARAATARDTIIADPCGTCQRRWPRRNDPFMSKSASPRAPTLACDCCSLAKAMRASPAPNAATWNWSFESRSIRIFSATA